MNSSSFFRSLAACLFAALLISGVQSSSSTAQHGTLTGVLRDADTHEPIPGTNVVLLSSRVNTLIRSAKTRADGTFCLKDVPFGSYTLRTTVLGYQPNQPQLTFRPQQANVALGTLSLQPMNSNMLAFN
ncbi:carboxypeptidase-like regulatory domain-containing protein [Hymenobacter aquaticus]|uniref:Carboxypeptidase-like regulatory domain-containing protein n=1 Tax=Hymenobacter aquaticus TaxID=1867101 RepID=A0A4Z0Q5M3_9BACT|nr:carboxypeptidase regulatory-like domain-containing protein [Hymenobacter aquaticus]TGE24776.1 carboxypeptidase-like regulatory domain-containing protein [Hymenobacter aquaticus]